MFGSVALLPRWMSVLCLTLGSTFAWGAQQQSTGAHKTTINRYCFSCHNTKVKAGGFTLDAVNIDDVSQNPAAWEKVVRKLRARYMPPSGAPRPDEKTYEALIATLETGLDKAASAKLNPGRTDTFRRLNRTEYQNSVRDLLAITIDVTSLLPSDEASHGFDNVTVGDLSPTLLERYLNAAQKISRNVVGTPIKSPGGITINLPPDLTQETHFDGLPFGTRGGTIVPYTFPLDAEYEIQLRLARDRNEHVEGLHDTHEVELMIDGERVKLFTVKQVAQGEDHHAVDQHLNLRLPIKAGPHEIAATFLMNRTALIENERQPYQAHFNMDRHPRITPAIYSVTINGPYKAVGPGDTPSRRRLFVCHPGKPSEDDDCAKKILSAVARRAYRRPVWDADVKSLMRFYRQGRSDGGFESGIEMALRAVLVSPEFLFRVEQDPPKIAPLTAYQISNLELASRLSFFMWSSIPDDELLNSAVTGKLTTPAVLEQQVRRMLKDDRSSVLVTNFAEQWLYLRNLASANPDMRLFTDFDDNLRQSFKKETELFFESIMREDRNVLDLLTANYTFLNERLAKHYGIPNVYGSRFRKVMLAPDSQRGGLLRQGSVLTVTSYPNRTSPVIRGKWILDNILGVPPPPPPPVVPPLKENGGLGKTLSMRERMAQHRENPACSGCHQLMDPVGFAFENYDGVGRWRNVDDSAAIDAAGSLPDGSKFNGVDGLQQVLMQRPDGFLTTFTEKLLTYGLGRGVEAYDAPAVRRIVQEARTKDNRFSSYILGIVSSSPFQMRRSQ